MKYMYSNVILFVIHYPPGRVIGRSSYARDATVLWFFGPKGLIPSQLRIQEFQKPGGAVEFLRSGVCLDDTFTHTLCFLVTVENKVHIISTV